MMPSALEQELDERFRRHVVMSAVGEKALSPFFATTTTVLLALLITWLVAETRALRDDLVAELSDSHVTSRIARIPGASMLAVAVVLLVGALTSLRVQFRGKAGSWEEILIWAALGLGFVGVAFSLVLNVLATSEITRNAALARTLGVGKKLVPVSVGLVFGLLASPLFHKERVQLAGAKFAVYGTCLTGGCGLKQRRGPGPAFPEAGRGERLKDGEQVLVVCQAAGSPPKGYKNRVWDLLPNGRYVSDVFVDTPNRMGGFSSGLPRCKQGTPKGTPG
jgi:hypothetical protein